MNEVLLTNIFFGITAFAFILFTIIVSVLLYHLIKIAKAVRRIVDRVEAGSEVLAEDLDNIRSSLNPAKLVQFIMSMIPGTKTGRKRK